MTRWCRDPRHIQNKNPDTWNLLFQIALPVMEKYGNIASDYGLEPVPVMIVIHMATVNKVSEILESWVKKRGLRAMYEELEKEVGSEIELHLKNFSELNLKK